MDSTKWHNSKHNPKVHRKLHQGTQSLHNIYKSHILQRQFKTGVPQGGVLSPRLFNFYIADIPPPRAPFQVMVYADDITITSTHTQARVIYTTIPTYSFCLDKAKPSLTKFRENNVHTLQNIRAIWTSK